MIKRFKSDLNTAGAGRQGNLRYRAVLETRIRTGLKSPAASRSLRLPKASSPMSRVLARYQVAAARQQQQDGLRGFQSSDGHGDRPAVATQVNVS
jgi:hypothetical protein